MTVLPDFLAPNLDIVFCGTAVGNVSAQRGEMSLLQITDMG